MGVYMFVTGNVDELNFELARESSLVDMDSMQPLQSLPDERWAPVLVRPLGIEMPSLGLFCLAPTLCHWLKPPQAFPASLHYAVRGLLLLSSAPHIHGLVGLSDGEGFPPGEA